MFKIIKWALLLAVVIVLLTAGGTALAFATGVLKPPEVQEVNNSWGQVTEEHTEVISNLVINNPNSIGISTGSVGVETEVFLNDVLLGTGGKDGVELPEGVSESQLTTIIDNSKVPEWWATHVENGEQTDARIAPSVKASLFGFDVSASTPEITRSIETDLLSRANSNEEEGVSIGPYGITVKERRFEWGEATEDQTLINGTVVVRNGTPVPITVTEIQFDAAMNGISVAGGTTEKAVLLAPGEDTNVPVTITLQHDPLIRWWPTHINNGEATDYRIRAVAALEGELPQPIGTREVRLPLVDYRDRFETDILGR